MRYIFAVLMLVFSSGAFAQNAYAGKPFRECAEAYAAFYDDLRSPVVDVARAVTVECTVNYVDGMVAAGVSHADAWAYVRRSSDVLDLCIAWVLNHRALVRGKRPAPPRP